MPIPCDRNLPSEVALAIWDPQSGPCGRQDKGPDPRRGTTVPRPSCSVQLCGQEDTQLVCPTIEKLKIRKKKKKELHTDLTVLLPKQEEVSRGSHIHPDKNHHLKRLTYCTQKGQNCIQFWPF